MEQFWLILIGWNVIVCMLYAVDKHCAIKKKHRISERTLITSAYFLGALGAILGMVVFNHKTSKKKFRVLIPLAVIENIVLLFVRFWR